MIDLYDKKVNSQFLSIDNVNDSLFKGGGFILLFLDDIASPRQFKYYLVDK